MELVPVYDKILSLTLEINAKRSPPSLKAEVTWLRSTMSQIMTLMERVRVSWNR